jgi:hypothetical protein
MATKTKTCSRCGLEKPLNAFYRQKGGAQGRRGRCKGVLQGRPAGRVGARSRCRRADGRLWSGGGRRG